MFCTLHTSMNLTVSLVVPVRPFPVLICSTLIILSANSSWLDVKALREIGAALRGVVSKNDNVPPWGWMPVWIIISFLRTLIATSVPIAVLAGVYSRAVSILVASKVLVGNKQT